MQRLHFLRCEFPEFPRQNLLPFRLAYGNQNKFYHAPFSGYLSNNQPLRLQRRFDEAFRFQFLFLQKAVCLREPEPQTV